MKRLLYKSTNKTKANLWPMLLPGIASIINNNYHHTFDDIPFRVYHNREPASMKHHIIPEDINWVNEKNKVDLNGMESSGHHADSSNTDSQNETIQTSKWPTKSTNDSLYINFINLVHQDHCQYHALQMQQIEYKIYHTLV